MLNDLFPLALLEQVEAAPADVEPFDSHDSTPSHWCATIWFW